MSPIINERQCGIVHGTERNPCLLYADDTALATESEQQLNYMVNVASDFIVKWNMTFTTKNPR